jgi:DNA-binding transcriptional LysR family regulator
MAELICCENCDFCDNWCIVRNSPSLTDYRIVLTLKDQGSFRTAAETLGMSPSALSRQLAALEAQLGVRLFDRDTRNVSPTVSGRAFARLAERMLNTAEDVMAEFDSHLSASRGRFTMPSVTAGLLPSLLKSFAEIYPGIDLRIVDALS